MGKLLKVLLTVVATLLLLIVVAAVVLPLVIEPNDFKPQIQAVVKDNIGRELEIEGDLKLSVFPWVGLSTGKLSLSNAEGFDDKPFARIEESDIKVKLMPLFSKQVQVNRIVLKGLNLNLAKNKQGIANWDDLAAVKKESKDQEADAKAGEKTATTGDLLAALAIGGIDIENANIVWDDRQGDSHLEIRDFNLKTDELAFDEPVGVTMSLALIDNKKQIEESIALNTDLLVNEKLDNIRLTGLRLESTTGGKDIPGEKLQATLQSDVALDLAGQTLALDKLSLTSSNLKIEGEIKATGIKEKPEFSGPVAIREFNPKELLRSLGIAVPAMRDEKALSSMAANFDLRATDDSVGLNGLTVKLDDSTINGTLNIRNFSAPSYGFNLKLDAIDADRYLSPEKNDKGKAGPAAVAAAGAALLPVETLRALNANGELSIGQLKVNNLKMKDVKLKLNAGGGLVNTQQSIGQFYQGSFSGKTAINVKTRQPQLNLDEKLHNVQIEPLLQDMQGDKKVRMTGLVNADARLKASGNSSEAIKSSLGGDVAFRFNDGVIRGFNLQKIIDNAKALIDGTPLPTENKNDQTTFSVIKGTAKINNGVVRNDDLEALSSRVRLDGKGSANLVSEKLDYKIDARLIKKATGEAKGVPLILTIGGSFDRPIYTLDIPAMLLEKNKDKIEKKKVEILEKLDKKLGPGVGDMLKGIFK